MLKSLRSILGSPPPRPVSDVSAQGVEQTGHHLARLEALARRARPRSHLAFIIDAVCWDEAKQVQRRMVGEARQFGNLLLRVIHFGGGRVEAYPFTWTTSADEIVGYMDRIACKAGGTQIVRAIDLARSCDPLPDAIVVIGDTCEERLETIGAKAKDLARSIPVFSFFDQVQGDRGLSQSKAHRLLASKTGGVFANFGDKLDLGSLMVAAAAYVTGGEPALLRVSSRQTKEGKAALQFIEQLRLPPPSGEGR